MNSGRQTGAAANDGNDTRIVIVHNNGWDPERHGSGFLQPIIEGYLRRRPRSEPPSDDRPFSPPL